MLSGGSSCGGPGQQEGDEEALLLSLSIPL